MIYLVVFLLLILIGHIIPRYLEEEESYLNDDDDE